MLLAESTRLLSLVTPAGHLRPTVIDIKTTDTTAFEDPVVNRPSGVFPSVPRVARPDDLNELTTFAR